MSALPGAVAALFCDDGIDWDAAKRGALGPHILRMRETPQDARWHAEGDVLAHTEMVVNALTSMPEWRALDARRRGEILLAALLHDIGKPACTRVEDGRVVSPGHAAVGANLARKLLFSEFGLCGEPSLTGFRETVCALIRYHAAALHILDADDPRRRVIQIAAIGDTAPDFSIASLSLLACADATGRVCCDGDEQIEKALLLADVAREYNCLTSPFPFPSPFSRRAYLSGRNVFPGQELYNDAWGEIILMSGLPASGKDTHIRACFPDLPVVSLDEIRVSRGISPTEPQGPVAALAREEARVYLRAHRPFVWNATCLTPVMREKQVSLFARYGATTRIRYLETDWVTLLDRNAARVRAVPENAIDRMLSSLEPPGVIEAERVEWVFT